jgi:hypothetical protein
MRICKMEQRTISADDSAGFARLTDNAKVAVSTADGTPAAGQPSQARGQKGSGQRRGKAEPRQETPTPPASPAPQ